MKHLVGIYVAIVVVMMAVACGESRHINDSLSHADLLMQDHPDSALSLLQAIDPDQLTAVALSMPCCSRKPMTKTISTSPTTR